MCELTILTWPLSLGGGLLTSVGFLLLYVVEGATKEGASKVQVAAGWRLGLGATIVGTAAMMAGIWLAARC